MRPEARRTALKAAFFVGGAGGDRVFAEAAGSRDAELRGAVAYSLYLLWRRDPERVWAILHALADRVTQVPVGRTSRLLKTLADASITIYINHPEGRGVAERTSELWKGVLRDRLRLHRRRWLEPAVFPLLSAVFSRRILETALLDQRPELFFGADPAMRARFARAVPLVAPSHPVEEAMVPDLAALLESPVRLHNVLAALVVAVHAVADFEATEPLVRALHDRVDAHGRLWLLQSFAVLLPETPPAWVPLVEELTRHLVESDRHTFMTRDGGALRDFDIALLPLGLAYAKSPAVEGLPYLEAALAEPGELQVRVVEGLAPVGFYHPEVLFGSLRPVMPALLGSEAARGALVTTLADVRTVWFDEVDLFLRGVGAPAGFRRQVASATSTGRMRRLVGRIGSYNNAVHQALHYPRMREVLLMGGLGELATAASARRFVRGYTRPVLDLLHEADFELIRWTKPASP